MKPKSTTQEVVKAKVSARSLSLLPADQRPLTPGFRLQVRQPRARGQSSAPITRGRAREGSLRSSTLLWDPYRCSHAVRSVGKREDKSSVRESSLTHLPLRAAKVKRDCCQTLPAGAWPSPSPNVTNRLRGTFWNKGECTTQNANEEHENGHNITA